ncbi:protein of unknown function [Salegentibacter echinorum]|uniref:DUF4920 domain-containing protein n=1 Tax=Salegentibacter echinorum TaxID=1073325 RepID=A0A1M5C0K6_SALEC|nr:DUF4920 domain-containing protein [Salegentibacter echinorum]SHF48283.1 protein of unknown function [Salegentibacter echinorum]
MKKIVILFALIFIAFSCQERGSKKAAEETAMSENVDYTAFGAEIDKKSPLSAKEALQEFNSLKPGDSVGLKFTSSIKSVCKKKGCWMILELSEGENVRVTFKDYGFFVPKNSEETEVIVEGKAFLNKISVEDQKHYAEDEGKPEAEIAAITSPKLTRAFVATGVLLKE